jgi:hypothetical protein
MLSPRTAKQTLPLTVKTTFVSMLNNKYHVSLRHVDCGGGDQGIVPRFLDFCSRRKGMFIFTPGYFIPSEMAAVAYSIGSGTAWALCRREIWFIPADVEFRFLCRWARWSWVMNITPQFPEPWGHSPRYAVHRDWGGPQSLSGHLGGNILYLSGNGTPGRLA